MAERTDLFYNTYGHFDERVLAAIRAETFGQDIGQNSWLTADEYERFISWLNLTSTSHVLEVASGSGGPALYLAEQAACRVTGIDANESGVATAARSAADSKVSSQVNFQFADANAPLPFDDGAFDALVCIDAMNHFPDRARALGEWRRVLRPGGRAVFTDPVVITGPVTNDELALRSSIGLFLFVPPGVNERLIEEAGLRLVKHEDITDNAALVSGRWHQSRQRHREDLLRIEGEERFDNLQKFFDAVHRLTTERRLSRIVYLVERSDIQIRVATPDDAEGIASVLREAFVEYEAAYTAEAFAATTPEGGHIRSRMDEGPMWVAVRDGVVVGTVSVVPKGESLYIRGMGVLPSARGKRLGEALLQQVEEFAAAHGYRRLYLSTTPFLARAIQLYERAGFERSDEGPHELYGTPLFTMEKAV
jgi:SAM-dependent methyltransferase/predicted N-acetyltransferase YhbS